MAQILKISIIDTETNELLDTEETTSISAPVLNYSGQDDKYQTIMASQLEFDLLVQNASNGKYLHLFTGNETRYKTILQDITDSENPVTLWQGFLLAENYSEPYQNSAFFVSFSAVDGLGLLKNKYLDDDFYSDKKNVVEIVTACLNLTGLSLPVSIAPAIENAVISLNVNEIAIDTSCYVDDDEKLTAYEILENLTVGHKLFQQNNQWYMVGFNRMSTIWLNLQNYTSVGVYINTEEYQRKNNIATFEATPTITMVPPQKTVVVEWEKNERSNILVEDIVYQKPEGGEDSIYTYALKYWQKVSTTVWTAEITTENMYGTSDYDVDNGDLIGLYDGASVLPTPNKKKFAEPFYVDIAEYITAANLETNYIELIDPVFLEGVYGEGLGFELNIEFKSWIDATADIDNVEAAFDNGDYDQVYFYSIELDGVEICSNKTSFSNNSFYDYDLSIVTETAGTYIKGSLSIDNVPVINDGFLNVKLHPPVGDDATLHLHKTVFTELELNFTSEDTETITKERAINYTTLVEETIFHGDAKTGLTTRKFLVDDSVAFSGVTINVDAQETQISATNYTHTTSVDLPDYNRWVYNITDDEHYLLKQNYNNLYSKLSDVYVAIPIFNLEEDTATQKKITIYSSDSTFLTTSHTIWITSEATTKTYDDITYVYDKWNRYGETEQIKFIEAYARILNDIAPTPLLKIEGVLFGLHWPLDLLEFNYVNPANYQFANLALNLSTGNTDAVIIAATTTNITDYE
ncbi:hypothetical protein ACFQ5N_02170 [Lutibacter holmesii]|uniref:Uncharacterized protein n=1 Tax=Lutibacter holmesii TaxID=1137985 RepID=A0ABW3WMT9_9FLAO